MIIRKIPINLSELEQISVNYVILRINGIIINTIIVHTNMEIKIKLNA